MFSIIAGGIFVVNEVAAELNRSMVLETSMSVDLAELRQNAYSLTQYAVASFLGDFLDLFCLLLPGFISAYYMVGMAEGYFFFLVSAAAIISVALCGSAIVQFVHRLGEAGFAILTPARCPEAGARLVFGIELSHEMCECILSRSSNGVFTPGRS